jgi:hypothetical protein
MKSKRIIGTALSLGLIGVKGCSEGSFGFSYTEEAPPPRMVVVEPAHICTHACAHYYHEGEYLVVRRGHRHGPMCGHAFDGRRWVVAVATPSGRVHVESTAPPKQVHPPPVRAVRIPAPPPGNVNAYVYDRRGSKWLKVSGKHVHGPHCGHVHVEGHWCMP